MGKKLVKSRKLVGSGAKRKRATTRNAQTSRPKITRQHVRTIITPSMRSMDAGSVILRYKQDNGRWREKAMTIDGLDKWAYQDKRIFWEVECRKQDIPKVSRILHESGRMERIHSKVKNITVFHGTTTAVLDDIRKTGKLHGWFGPEGGIRRGEGVRYYANRATIYHGGKPVIIELKLPEDMLKPFDPEYSTTYIPRGLHTFATTNRGRDWISSEYIVAYLSFDGIDKGWVRHKWNK